MNLTTAARGFVGNSKQFAEVHNISPKSAAAYLAIAHRGNKPKSKRRKFKPEYEKFLGKMTDSALAQIARVSTQTVRGHRILLGIPVVVKMGIWDKLLGTIPDMMLAKQKKVNQRTVSARRMSLGISSWQRQHLDNIILKARKLTDLELLKYRNSD